MNVTEVQKQNWPPKIFALLREITYASTATYAIRLNLAIK